MELKININKKSSCIDFKCERKNFNLTINTKNNEIYVLDKLHNFIIKNIEDIILTKEYDESSDTIVKIADRLFELLDNDIKAIKEDWQSLKYSKDI